MKIRSRKRDMRTYPQRKRASEYVNTDSRRYRCGRDPKREVINSSLRDSAERQQACSFVLYIRPNDRRWFRLGRRIQCPFLGQRNTSDGRLYRGELDRSAASDIKANSILAVNLRRFPCSEDVQMMPHLDVAIVRLRIGGFC